MSRTFRSSSRIGTNEPAAAAGSVASPQPGWTDRFLEPETPGAVAALLLPRPRQTADSHRLRLADGAAICIRCQLYPSHACSRCDQEGELHAVRLCIRSTLSKWWPNYSTLA